MKHTININIGKETKAFTPEKPWTPCEKDCKCVSDKVANKEECKDCAKMKYHGYCPKHLAEHTTISPSDKTWEEDFVQRIAYDAGDVMGDGYDKYSQELKDRLTSATIKAKDENYQKTLLLIDGIGATGLFSPQLMGMFKTGYIKAYAIDNNLNLEEPKS